MGRRELGEDSNVKLKTHHLLAGRCGGRGKAQGSVLCDIGTCDCKTVALTANAQYQLPTHWLLLPV